MAISTTTFVRIINGTEINTLGSIVTTFNIGQSGASAYQSYLATTLDDPKLSEAEWSAAGKSGVQSVSSTNNNISVDNTDLLNPTLTFQLVDNQNLLTDDELAVVQNTSGENTGDQDLSGLQVTSEKGANNGYAGLDANAKIATANLPDSILGNLKFKGTWNLTNDIVTSDDVNFNGLPLPISDASTLGLYFILTTDGIFETVEYFVGDWIVSNGTAGWTKVDNTDAVKSVNGQYGIVSLDYEDVGAAPALTSDQNYVSDAELEILQDTSGVNSGDETQDTIGDLIEITELETFGDLTKVAVSDSAFLKWVAGLRIYNYVRNGILAATNIWSALQTFTLGGLFGTKYTTTLTTATNNTAITVIQVADTTNFPATGTILIGGITRINYTSRTGTSISFASTTVPTYAIGTTILLESFGWSEIIGNAIKTSKIIPNSTSFAIRNQADTANIAFFDSISGLHSFNDANGNYIFRLVSGGNGQFLNGFTIGGGTAGFFAVEFVAKNDYKFRISSDSSPFGVKDIGWWRDAAGRVGIYDGNTTTAYRDLKLRNLFADKIKANQATGIGFNNSSDVEVFAIDNNGFQLPQYDDIMPSGLWISATGGAAPDQTTHTIGGITFNLISFDGGSQEETFSNQFEITHGIDIEALNRVTAPLIAEIHTHGMPATTGAGVVKIFFDLVYFPANGGAGAAPIAFGTYSVLITINANEQYWHKLGGVEIAKPTAGFQIGDIIAVRYRRSPLDIQDTYTGDWLFKQCALHMPLNSNGSRQRYVK